MVVSYRVEFYSLCSISVQSSLTAIILIDVRYFMIKSWNAENVEIAQRDVSDAVLAFAPPGQCLSDACA